MKIFSLKNFSLLLFLISGLLSLAASLILYDSTTGLDWPKYIRSVEIFLGINDLALDSQGALYFFYISKFLKLYMQILNINEIDHILNSSVQIANFILYLIGLLGIYKVFKSRKFATSSIFIVFSILNFFPPAYYMRLTMKPEIFAFALLPWSIYSLDSYFDNKTTLNFTFATVVSSLLITQKASIAGMILVCFLVLYYSEIKKIKDHYSLILSGISLSFFLLYGSFKTFGIWLFERPVAISEKLTTNWDNVANLNFFYFIDIKNLLENPFRHIHADSMVSITLLDTLSDYFGFFWNHREEENLVAFNKMSFSDNFLIQTYLSEYISILFTLTFYFLIFFLYAVNIKDKNFLILPLVGLFILIVNSLGFPSNNFNPETGDLFKVHYYSFLLTFSFSFLLIYLISKFKNLRIFSFLLIPLFLLSMGFPKDMDETYSKKIIEKIEYSEICNIVNFYDLDCNLYGEE